MRNALIFIVVFILFLACALSAPAQDYIKKGENYYIKGDFKSALLMWDKAKELEPDNLVIEKYIGLAVEKIGSGSLAEQKEKEKSLKKRREKEKKAPFLTKFSEAIGIKDRASGPSIEQIILKQKKALTLQDCVDIAIDNHIPLKVARKQITLAEIRLLEAKRKLGPTLAFKWEESSGKMNDRHYAGRKLYFEGKQPVFYGGELFYGAQQASVNLEVVKTDCQRIKDELVMEVKKAYYSLDKAIKAVEVQSKLYTNAKGLYDMIKKQSDAGVVSRIEYLNVISQYNQAQFQHISSEEDVAIAKLILQQAMNTEMDFKVEPVPEPKIIVIELDDCYALAYANHPKMKINMLMQEYYDYEKKIARSKGWPRVDFMGSYGRAFEQYVNKDLGTNDHKRGMSPQWYVGFKSSIPIWGNTLSYSITKEKWPPVVSAYRGTESMTHSGSISFLDKLDYYSEKEESDISFQRAIQEFNKAKQEISLEVKETFFKYKKALLQIGVARSKIEYQERNVEIMDERRRLGETQSSDVIEAMLKLAEEQFSYLQAVSDYYIAVAGLNKAIGVEEYFQI